MGLKASDTAVLTLTFHFLSSALFLLIFLPHFFSFAGHLVGFILVGKVFTKAFLDLRIRWKERYVGSGTRISRNFSGKCYVVFCLFLPCPWLNCVHSDMVWKISSLGTSKQTKLSLTIKTDDVTRGRRDVDPTKQFWVA